MTEITVSCVTCGQPVEQEDAFMEEVAYEHVFADGTKTLSYALSCAGFPPRTDAEYVNLLYTNPVRKHDQDWSRFHHLMAKHGLHPGRTDDDLIDILAAHLEKVEQGKPVRPMSDEQIDQIWMLNGGGLAANRYHDFARAIEAHIKGATA